MFLYLLPLAKFWPRRIQSNTLFVGFFSRSPCGKLTKTYRERSRISRFLESNGWEALKLGFSTNFKKQAPEKHVKLLNKVTITKMVF